MTRFAYVGSRPSRRLLLPTETIRPRLSLPAENNFEFVHIIGSDMCAAEDVFLRGQLVPFKPPPPPPPPPAASHLQSLSLARPSPKTGGIIPERYRGRHRRAESLDAFERGAGAASRYWAAKGSFSAGYQRLRPLAEEPNDVKPSPRPLAAGAPPPTQRPKWYVLWFGSVKVPAETDMKSIKTRLQRRSSEGPRTDSPGSGKTNAPASGAWKLLRSLSCKGDEVVNAVEVPPGSYGPA